MAYSDEYRELIEDARISLKELFDASTPDSWMRLRQGWRDLTDTLEADDQASRVDERQAIQQQQREEHDRRDREYERRRAAWNALDREAQKGRVLDALGDARLTRREIILRMRQEMPEVEFGDGAVAGLLNEMLASGDVEREKVPRTPNCDVRKKGSYEWSWRRSCRPLSPELQDIEQRLKEA